MKNAIRIFIVLLGVVVSGAGPAHPAEMSRTFIEAARKVKPSVVNIIIYRTSMRDGRRVYAKSGFGSGTLISGEGYVVTNYHVVRKGDYYQMVLSDGSEYEPEPVFGNAYYVADPKTDIAIIKIAAGKAPAFIPAVFGDSDRLEEGEWVIAVGTPYGLRQSFTSGIISSTGRSDIGFADIEDFIQTDVPINPGNSGGPLVNLRGELVGINTAIRTVSGGFQGISFAIPSNIVRRVSVELLKYGRIRRGWLGFLARERSLPARGERNVVEVMSVIKDSPAEAAGIRTGDVVREVDGKRITTLGELVAAVGNKPIGSTVTIRAAREGYIGEYALVLREKAEFRRSQQEGRRLLGAYGIELDDDSLLEGVVISAVSPLGEAYRHGLKRGDCVRSVNGRVVGNVDDFLNVFRRDSSRLVRIEVLRDSRLYTVDFSADIE
ncbi:MAG TPA: trypsin-like peptidase domain-containing protein [Spirochaetota bacterium]|nr:trypsin-like peptidase domain-containing protein [Spirochaetota bacterium]